LLLALLLLCDDTAARSKKKKKGRQAGAPSRTPTPLSREQMEGLRPLMEAAEAHAAAGAKQAAIEKYLAALELAPNFDMAHYNVAVTFEETGQFEEASIHFRRTLGLLPQGDPRRIDVLSRLGQLSARLGELLTGPQHADQKRAALGEAEALLSEVATEQPTNGQVRFVLGKVLAEQGKGKRAISHLRAALKASPSHPPTLLQLGLALHRHGGAEKREEAERYLDSALRADNADYHAQVGLQLRETMPDRARAHFERALALDPKHQQATSTYYRLGAMLHLLGELEEEDALYQRAVAAGVRNFDRNLGEFDGYFARFWHL